MLRAITWCLLGLAAGAAAAQTPQSVTATYQVYMNGARVAVMNETFEVHERSYRIVSESTPLGALALFQKPASAASSGSLTPQGLRPDTFEGRLIGTGQVRADFDWKGGRLTFGQDGKSATVALPAGAQDRLSSMYQFMYYKFDQRERIDFVMTDGRRFTHQHFLITPDVDVDTPLGRMSTLHLVKQTEPDSNSTEIWLARQHHFLPARMVIRESNGTRYEQLLTRIETKP